MGKTCPKGSVRVGDRCISEDDYFDAILAKNQIARKIGDNPGFGDEFILHRLKEIEVVIGESNQPSVEDSFDESREAHKEREFRRKQREATKLSEIRKRRRR